MARHQAVDAFGDRGEERRQMRRLHLGPRRIDGGQSKMGVEGGVPLAGEVLGARRDPALLHALDARQAVARDHGRVFAIGADPDVRAVALREDVEHGREVHVHSQPPQFAGLEEALAKGERLVAGGPHREVVGENRRRLAEHDDAAALVIGGDEQATAESRLEIVQQPAVLLRRLEVPPIQDEPGGARVAEEADVRVGELRPGQAKHQALADQVLEIGHSAIIGRRGLAARGLRQVVTVRRLTPMCRDDPLTPHKHP